MSGESFLASVVTCVAVLVEAPLDHVDVEHFGERCLKKPRLRGYRQSCLIFRVRLYLASDPSLSLSAARLGCVGRLLSRVSTSFGQMSSDLWLYQAQAF